MPIMTIKNRSSKISPGGVLTLPLSARKTLRMEPGKGTRVAVTMQKDSVLLRPDPSNSGSRVSPKGQMELVGEPRAVLEKASHRHYWFELDDEQQIVRLYPY
ncbi:hypothetical protein NKJ73_22075 [Mesorhizobium sp. M0074]|uniref:hypothetical protein n=1 Tax=unclassified Mesorhizobium TaxID=325217 RepID=UPI00333D96B3